MKMRIFLFLLLTLSTDILFAQAPYQLTNVQAINTNYGEITMDNVLYMTLQDSATGEEMWRTDGTVAGTYIVKDMTPGTGFSHITYYSAINHHILFDNNTSTYGSELWSTDGTANGTTMLKDIYPGVTTGFVFQNNHAVYNNLFYFEGKDSLGYALWQTDGTVAGTKIVDGFIHTQYGFSWMYVFNNKLFVSGFDSLNQTENFLSIDNSTSPVTINDITPLTNNMKCRSAIHFFEGNGELYFSAYNQNYTDWALWRTDGNSTQMVCQFRTGTNSSFAAEGRLNPNCEIIFASTDSTGYELFALDLTTHSITLLKDIYPGPFDSYAGVGNVNWYYTSFNKLLFFANDSHGTRIWATDGTVNGTTMLTNALAGIGVGYGNFEEHFNRVYFPADDGVHGSELWSSDGTPAGTNMLMDCSLNGDGYTTLYDFDFERNGKLFFSSYQDQNTSVRDVYCTDGTPTNTFSLDINPGAANASDPFNLGAAGNWTYFWADDGVHGEDLWRTDGTTANCSFFADIVPGSGSSWPSFNPNEDKCFSNNNDLYFKAKTAATGMNEELFKVDYASNSVVQLTNLNYGREEIEKFHILNNRYVVFPMANSVIGNQLWAFDLPGVGTSVKNVEMQDPTIYPNPANKYINIEFAKTIDVDISIYNLFGEIKYQSKFAGIRQSINTEALNNGIYIIQIKSGQNVMTKKIIIEK